MIWFCIAQALKLNSSILTWYVLSTSKLTRLNEKTVESLKKSVGDAGKMKLRVVAESRISEECAKHALRYSES